MKLLQFVETFNFIIAMIITVLYSYQMVYLVLGLLRRHCRDSREPSRLRKYAVLISARNEEGVIGELIESLKKQNYPPRQPGPGYTAALTTPMWARAMPWTTC